MLCRVSYAELVETRLQNITKVAIKTFCFSTNIDCIFQTKKKAKSMNYAKIMKLIENDPVINMEEIAQEQRQVNVPAV